MSKGQFNKGFDDRRNLQGRPKGSKNNKTIVSEFIKATFDYKNPFTNEQMQITPKEALLIHSLYLALKKDNTVAIKILLDKIDTFEDPTTNFNWDFLE